VFDEGELSRDIEIDIAISPSKSLSPEEETFLQSSKVEVEDYLKKVLSEEKVIKAMQSLFPDKSSLRAKAILKRDFFGDSVTLEIDTGLELFSQGSDPLSFLKLFPKIQRRITSSTLPLESLKKKFSQKYPQIDFANIDSKDSLFKFAGDLGLVITEEWSPSDDLEKFLETIPEKYTVKIDSCPPQPIEISNFSPEELDEITRECCEPSEIQPVEKFEKPIADAELPEIFSEEQIFDLVKKIEDMSLQLATCSSSMAIAGRSIEEYREFLMRFDILDTYVQERNLKFQALNSAIGSQLEAKFTYLKKNQDIVTQITEIYRSTFSPISTAFDTPFSNTNTVIVPEGSSLSDTNSILFKEYTDINSSSLAGKEDTSLTTYFSEISSLVSAYNLNTVEISGVESSISAVENSLGLITFSPDVTEIASLVGSFPSESAKSRDFLNTTLSNQVGSDEGNFFITIGSTSLHEEVRTHFEMFTADSKILGAIILKDLGSSEDIPSSESEGIYHSNLWTPYDSPERIDFLFSAAEQGYLEKPSNEEMTSDTQGSLDRLSVDESLMTDFMLTYKDRQETRLLSKIAEIQSSEITTNIIETLKAKAREEANYAFSLGKFSLDFFSFSSFENSNFKEFSDDFLETATVFSSVRKAIDDRIVSLQQAMEQAESCIADQESQLREMYVFEQTIENLPPPCSDPFGISAINPFLPGITKNCYWKEYTKCMQTISLMPIPEILHLNKRLFRYYPVGLRFPVFFPPGVFPSLALGIPDSNISIPMPMLWNHVFTLTTTAGIFVLWINYTPPFFVFPFLMHIDEKGNAAFLVTPSGKTDIPHSSINWEEGAMYTRSLIQNIPGIEIPLKNLPSFDSLIDTSSTETSSAAISKIQEKLKALTDKIQGNSLGSLSEEDIARRAKLNTLREKIKAGIENIPPPLEEIREMLDLVKKEVTVDAQKIFDFEPFSFPNSSRKQKDPKGDGENFLEVLRDIEEAGGKIDINFVSASDILTREIYRVLDTKAGNEFLSGLQETLELVENDTNAAISGITDLSSVAIEKAEARALAIVKSFGDLLEIVIPEIDAEKLGFLALPISLIPLTLPEPCNYNVKLSPLPTWVSATLGGLLLLPSVAKEISGIESLSILGKEIDFSLPLPSARDAVLLSSSLLLSTLMSKIPLDLPGWPDKIPTVDNLDQLSQFFQVVKQEVFKKKLRLPSIFEGISPITITPDKLNEIMGEAISLAIETSVAMILTKFVEATSETKLAEALLLFKAIVGTEIYDLNEDDIKSFASSVIKSSSDELEKLKPLLSLIDISPDKEEKSFLKKLFPESKGSDGDDTLKIQIAPDVALAIFLGFASKVATGTNKTIPWIAALGLCAIGPVGWFSLSTFNPTAAMEKFPPYERLCLKNIPYVIFLDQLIATAQRVGGIANNYLPPYRG
jgi:hypothetical protein